MLYLVKTFIAQDVTLILQLSLWDHLHILDDIHIIYI